MLDHQIMFEAEQPIFLEQRQQSTNQNADKKHDENSPKIFQRKLADSPRRGLLRGTALAAPLLSPPFMF